MSLSLVGRWIAGWPRKCCVEDANVGYSTARHVEENRYSQSSHYPLRMTDRP